MPPRKAKNKIVLESDSDSEIDIAIIKNNSKENITKSTLEESIANFKNEIFDVKEECKKESNNFINKYNDLVTKANGLGNINSDDIEKIIGKLESIEGIIMQEENKLIKEINILENIIQELRFKDLKIKDIVKEINDHKKKLEDDIKKNLEEEKRKANLINNTQNQTVQIPNNRHFTSIKDLANELTNHFQRDILWRINTDAEGAKVYLQNFTPNTDKKKKTLQGTINILGNYNRSKGIRESYEVKVFKDDPKGSFWCTCADHKFNAGKKNIVCKHICFIVCKVLKITQTYFFEPVVKRLSDEHLQQLLAKFGDNSDMWKDKQYVRKSDFITIDDFKIFPNPISDTCTFCYDEMTNGDKDIACACPICKHCFHEECMQVWLEGHDKCSFCSNNFWIYYKRIKGGETKISLAANKL